MAEQEQTFAELAERLEEIVGEVRSKDTSLEHSLDLFDEAVELGSLAVDLVDKGGFSAEEEALIAQESYAEIEAETSDLKDPEVNPSTAEEG